MRRIRYGATVHEGILSFSGFYGREIQHSIQSMLYGAGVNDRADIEACRPSYGCGVAAAWRIFTLLYSGKTFTRA
jgi:hypothetical protein